MRTVLAIALLTLLASCARGPITPKEYDAAFRVCNPNGGLMWVAQEDSYTEYTRLRVACKNNDMVVYMTVQRDKPVSPQPAASAASQ